MSYNVEVIVIDSDGSRSENSEVISIHDSSSEAENSSDQCEIQSAITIDDSSSDESQSSQKNEKRDQKGQSSAMNNRVTRSSMYKEKSCHETSEDTGGQSHNESNSDTSKKKKIENKRPKDTEQKRTLTASSLDQESAPDEISTSASDKESDSSKDGASPGSEEDKKPAAITNKTSLLQKAAINTAINRYLRSGKKNPLRVLSAEMLTPPSFKGALTYFTSRGAKRKFSQNQQAIKCEQSKKIKKGDWRELVEATLREVRNEMKARKKERFQEALRSKNEIYQRCMSYNSTEKQYPILNVETNLKLNSSYPEGNDHPLPRDNFHTVFLKRSFGLPDDEKGDSSDIDDKSKGDGSFDTKVGSPTKPIEIREKGDHSSFEDSRPALEAKYASIISEFNRGEKIGVGYEKAELEVEIKEVLERLEQVIADTGKVHEYLALLCQVDLCQIKKCVEKINMKNEARQQPRDNSYKNSMSSFRDLFCRRCLTYDCNLHGLAEERCPDVQAEIAIQREKLGYWKGVSTICLPFGEKSKDKVELSETQKMLCQKLFHIFHYNLEKVSAAMGVSQSSILGHVTLEPFKFRTINPSSVVETRNKNNKSNTYNPSFIKKIVEMESHRFFVPCYHSRPCGEESCTCIQNGLFCTKACIWGASSENFFRGCKCTGKCSAAHCPCFAANRECDPDLCKKCGACTDAPNKAATTQTCRNDNIGMRRHTHLLVAKSKVAGWGLFTKYPLNKGDYVHEYLGEVIPHDEAEMRGEVYDERNQTYLFDLSSDYAVDALRKGNKTRFINHSRTPNIAPRILSVNGDFRIGFFAKMNIPAQSELFFDYGKMFFKSTHDFGLSLEKSKTSRNIDMECKDL